MYNYDALLLYKAFIFPKPWSMFLFPCKNEIYFICWYSCTVPFMIKTFNTLDVNTNTGKFLIHFVFTNIYVWPCWTVKDSHQILLPSASHYIQDTYLFLKIVILLVSQVDTLCYLQNLSPVQIFQLIANYLKQIISSAKRIPVTFAWFWCQI